MVYRHVAQPCESNLDRPARSSPSLTCSRCPPFSPRPRPSTATPGRATLCRPTCSLKIPCVPTQNETPAVGTPRAAAASRGTPLSSRKSPAGVTSAANSPKIQQKSRLKPPRSPPAPRLSPAGETLSPGRRRAEPPETRPQGSTNPRGVSASAHRKARTSGRSPAEADSDGADDDAGYDEPVSGRLSRTRRSSPPPSPLVSSAALGRGTGSSVASRSGTVKGKRGRSGTPSIAHGGEAGKQHEGGSPEDDGPQVAGGKGTARKKPKRPRVFEDDEEAVWGRASGQEARKRGRSGGERGSRGDTPSSSVEGGYEGDETDGEHKEDAAERMGAHEAKGRRKKSGSGRYPSITPRGGGKGKGKRSSVTPGGSSNGGEEAGGEQEDSGTKTSRGSNLKRGGGSSMKPTSSARKGSAVSAPKAKTTRRGVEPRLSLGPTTPDGASSDGGGGNGGGGSADGGTGANAKGKKKRNRGKATPGPPRTNKSQFVNISEVAGEGLRPSAFRENPKPRSCYSWRQEWWYQAVLAHCDAVRFCCDFSKVIVPRASFLSYLVSEIASSFNVCDGLSGANRPYGF